MSTMVFYHSDPVAYWEWRPVGTAYHHERVWHCTSLAQEKIKIQNIVSNECIFLLQIKTTVRQGPPYYILTKLGKGVGQGVFQDYNAVTCEYQSV